MKHADHDAAASRILASWLDQRDRGTAPPIDELIRAHPNCADELRAGLAGLRTLERPAAGEDESNRLPVPEQIGDYRIVREVGRGGMGVVFEAEQVSMGRRVALKLLTPTLTGAQRAVKRFQREAKAAGRLHHTNIVPVYALGQEAGFWYYAMELVVGLSLSEMLGQMRRLDDESRTEHGLDVLSSSAGTRSDSGSRTGDTWFRRVAEVFAGVADALQVAHDEGVIHRDIKPSNLLLDADGVLKIVDFGLAHLEDPGPSMTLTGDLVGTPAYMSPEQALAKRITLDHRTDIYSLGATLYEVLTLQPPFVGRSLQELCAQIVTKDPALPRRVDVRIPRDLETIVLKAMEKDRDKRYQRAADFAEDLRLFALGSVIAARRAGPIERTWRKIKRHKGVASLAAGLILVSAVGASLAWRVNTEASQRRELEYLQLVARAETELGEVVMTEANQSFVAELRPRDAHERPPGTSSPGIELLAEAIDLMPQRPEAYVLRALASDRSKDERLSDIERAEANGVATTSAALMRRMLGDATGNTPELEVEDVQPKTPLEAYLKASILLRDGGPRTREAAIELLGRAIDSSSLESFVRRLSLERRARVRINDNDLQGAISDLEALRGLGDARLEVQLRIADLWIRLGRQQRGDELFDEAVSAVAARDEIAEWRELLRVLAHVIQRLDWVESAGDELRATRPESVEAALMVAKDLHDVSRHLPMGSGSGAGPWPRVRAQEAARAVYEVAARLDPESVEVLDAYASLLRGMEAWRDVLAVYERRLRLTPDHLPTLRRMEDALRSSGDLEGALAAAERTLEIAPDDPRSHVDVARALTLLGRSDEAIAAAERGIACATAGDAPGLVGVCYQWKGEALLREDRHEEALLAFDEARRLIVHVDGLLASFSHRMRLFRATALEHLGRLADAIEEIRTVTDAEPADYRAHTELCRVLTKAGEWDALQAERQRLVDRFPQEPTTWNNLAWFWVGDETPDEHHDAEQGLEAAERAVLLSHKPDPAFLDTLAHAQFLSGELAAAIASQRQAIDAALAGGDERRAEYEAHLERFEAALAATPAGSTPSTSTARALHHLRANELDEAEALARSALAAEPDQPDALGIVAEVALARGRAEVAVAPARRAVELDPRSERLHRVLVHALRASGAPAERDEEIARWIRLAITERDPARRVLALQRYGQRATGRWDRETAVVAFGLACEVQTDNPAAWFWFAVSQRHAGRYRAALAAYRRGIELAARVAKPWAGIPGTPSEQWLRRVELLAAREPHLAALVGGRAEPEDADECIAAAWLAYERQQFATAVALRRRSMEFEPELATDPRRDARYQMACAATLGGFGLGFDAETESQRQALRATAHSTLSELLVQWREWSASDDPERAAFARARLRHWIRDKDVNKSRDATRLANLTEEERAAWQALWSEVDGLLE